MFLEDLTETTTGIIMLVIIILSILIVFMIIYIVWNICRRRQETRNRNRNNGEQWELNIVDEENIPEPEAEAELEILDAPEQQTEEQEEEAVMEQIDLPGTAAEDDTVSVDSFENTIFAFMNLSEGDICPVCHEEFTLEHKKKGDTLTVTNCQHTYHRPCLITWFQTKQRIGHAIECPICRRLPTQLDHYRNGVPCQVDSIFTAPNGRATVVTRPINSNPNH